MRPSNYNEYDRYKATKRPPVRKWLGHTVRSLPLSEGLMNSEALADVLQLTPCDPKSSRCCN